MENCPKCGCQFFTGAGAATLDTPIAWEDKDGKWYSGPYSEQMKYSCQGCNYSYKIVKKCGKVVEDSRLKEEKYT